MVSTALYTGLSGLRAHQTYIDVIGNNLANVSTPGFRGSRATFSDVLSFTVRAGSGPNGNFGGQNPLQIGTGTFMSSVDMNTNQGTLQDTGRSLDVALQGRGFFTMTNGSQTFYSRVGAFGIDANRSLVDLRTGLRVVSSTGGDITIPTSDTLPAQPTSEVDIQGNLPADVGGPLAEIVESKAPLNSGTAASKVAIAPGASAPQYNLSANAGQTLLVSVNDGAQQQITVPSTDPINTGPVDASVIADWLNDNLTGATATANDATGEITISTDQLGSDARIKFDDGSSSTGLLTLLGLNAQQASGTQATALETTDLNSLTARITSYNAGDPIVISGKNPDGSSFGDTFTYGTNAGAGQDGTTLGDLIAFINQTVAAGQSAAELTTDGNIRLTATNKEEADLNLTISDGSGSTGELSWPTFEIAQDGTGPDEAPIPFNVVDSLGRVHQGTMTFTRSTDDSNVWDLNAEIDSDEGTLAQSSIGQVRFNDDGSFNVVGGGSNSLSFSWNGITAAQDVQINLGTPGQFDGVAMLGNSTTVAAIGQDGYAAGTLLNVGFNNNGELTGFYSNGQNQTLDTLRISMFSNEGGLVRQGDTLFVESPNSDDAISTTANAAGAGSIRSGQLENSNVDIAQEFVNLIEAQRGFQANSRVITTTDEILSELMNIVR